MPFNLNFECLAVGKRKNLYHAVRLPRQSDESKEEYEKRKLEEKSLSEEKEEN